MSRKLTPAAAMSTRSSPGPGSGVPCSATSSTSGPPCRLTTTVRIALSCRGCIAARTSAPTLGEKHLIGLAISQQARRSLLRGDAPAAYTAAGDDLRTLDHDVRDSLGGPCRHGGRRDRLSDRGGTAGPAGNPELAPGQDRADRSESRVDDTPRPSVM